MMRVAVIITRLAGGAGALALRGAQSLDPARWQVAVVTGAGQRRLLDAAIRSGIEVLVEPSLRAPISPADDLAALHRLTGLLRSRGFDVAHTHCAKAGVLGRLAAHRAGIPRVVHTYHGFPFHPYQSSARRQLYVAIERRLRHLTDVTLCVGAAVAAEAVRRELTDPRRVRTIGVVVDQPASRDDARARAAARDDLGISAETTVVGSVGRLTYQKAPEDFLTALHLLNRARTVGVWVGSGDLASRTARLARSLLGDNAVLTGERADVPYLLPAFDVFVLASRYEGLPTALAEAMAAGVPAIATAVNAVPDLLVPGETGLLVPPERPDLLAEAVDHLLSSPATAARFARNARARVSGRYTEAALRAELEAAYARPRAISGL
ncbi:glycosyltransferase [Amycolatopsis benzoatilytica]|uniref:glycosyltransferase n=1 Tax=Amycolatopsis benzoatilytica TaxID=346045 RepID=UPI00037FFE29|nr:glycosyltransferase [Amycolatopsis benzoatilytica]